ncbi:type II secretion system protein [Tunturiibacter lichenicola]|uniref:type II secretion system protein n=1 Tax=Tunturiibacter lichenicola TaxID=2051959 RepID=UPI0021B26EC6|nr:type II secretion system protein [Edaphobacter lichenicola]
MVCSWLRHRGLDSRRSCGHADEARGASSEQGFMLVGLIVAIFIILLVLSIAAPKVSKELQREREVEAVHRGNQYVRAIQLYGRKNGAQFPATLEALEKTNNQRYLRQRYVDPMTGKADWRLIHVGEAKTTVKGFFGKPLTGLTPGLGSAAGMASSGGIGAGANGSSSQSAFGSPGAGAYGSSSSGSSAFGSSSSGSSAFGSSSPGTSSSGGTSSPTTGSTATGGAMSGTDTSGSTTSGSPGVASQSATSFTGGGSPFVGVGLPKEATSIIVLNEQTTYNTWEFIYDPRIEQLKANVSIFGGGPATASGSGSLGSAGSMTSGTGTNGGTGFGSTPGSGFGSTPSSGFGSQPSSGFGSSPSTGTGTSSPTTPTTPQQQQ